MFENSGVAELTVLFEDVEQSTETPKTRASGACIQPKPRARLGSLCSPRLRPLPLRWNFLKFFTATDPVRSFNQ
jgi:hypothetical protein